MGLRAACLAPSLLGPDFFEVTHGSLAQ
jgi:hypothetical protein